MLSLARPAPAAALLALAQIACSPTYDWRDTAIDGGLVALFPCRPDRHARGVTLAGQRVTMQVRVCESGDTTFALAVVELPQPADVTPVLGELRTLAVAHLGAAAPASEPLQVPGMTPNPQALQLALHGRLSDGSAVAQQAAFFAKGVRVYQASVIGAAPAPEAVSTFFAGLRFP